MGRHAACSAPEPGEPSQFLRACRTLLVMQKAAGASIQACPQDMTAPTFIRGGDALPQKSGKPCPGCLGIS